MCGGRGAQPRLGRTSVAVNKAAVDIGSNTVRLLVVDDEGNDLERRYVVTGLGRGVDRTRSFRPDAVAHSLEVLADYAAVIQQHGASAVRAVATSATRDAEDGAAFLDAAEQVLGIRPEVISGEEEARLAFRASRLGDPGPAPVLAIDVGGGSTEFMYGSDAPDYVTSVDIGSVRLTDRLLSERPAAEAVDAARTEVDRAFLEVAVPGPIGTTVGVDGTFTTLATMVQAVPYHTPVPGAVLTRDEVTAQIDRLALLTLDEIEGLPGIDPARAPVILGGAVIVERAMAKAGVDEVVVSGHDLLDGIAASIQ